MIKHRLKELTKSFESHVDSEKTALLKRTKTEIESNVTKIYRLIKNEDHEKNEGKKEESELLTLVEDFYKEYQSIYASYNHLINESEKIVFSKVDDSDSEYYSSDEIEIDDDKANHNIKQQLETATEEIADLRLKLASTSQQVLALKSENETTLSKIQEKEMINKELRIEADQLLMRTNELEGQIESVKEDLEKQLRLKNCEIDHLRHEKESLDDRVFELEGLLSKRAEESFSITPTHMEHRDTKLCGKTIADKLRILKEEDQKYKESKNRLPETKLTNIQVVERKIEDLADRYKINIEDNIRILSRRILVAEQIHTENKENYGVIKEKYKKENEELKDKIANYEEELKKRNDLIESPSNERTTRDEIKQLKHNMESLVAMLNDKEKQQVMLRKKVFKLEEEVNKEGEENVKLVKDTSQLKVKVDKYEKEMKELDERLLSLGDEKREAIRQLCILIDYHRNRFDDLKQVKSNFNVRQSRTPA